MSVEKIELIKNGSFSSVKVNGFYKWHIPTDWQVMWDDEAFEGTLELQSVGAVYDASNALLLKYSAAGDIVYDRVFPPGIYQVIDLTDTDLTNIDHYTFRFDARAINNTSTLANELDIFFYEGYYNSSTGTYEIAPNKDYNDYLLKRTFDVSDITWTNNTFDIYHATLSNKIYIIGITPHIKFTGVKYDDRICATKVIIDDVSLMAIYKEEEDLEDTGLIKNGSFQYWESDMPCEWSWIKSEDYFGPFKISQSSDYDKRNSLVIEIGKDGYNTVLDSSLIAPGVYQLIDLSGYDKDTILLNVYFNFYARVDDINHTFNYSYHDVDLYIYKADEEGNPIGGLTSFVYYKRFNLPTKNPEWGNYYCSAKLKPGYYYIGITPSIAMGAQPNPYAEQLYIVVDDFIGEVSEVEQVVYHGELIKSGSFETMEWVNNWDYDSSKLDVGSKFSQPYPEGEIKKIIGVQSCIISYNDGVIVDEVETYHYGFKQSVVSLSSSPALFSFWYSSVAGNPKFKVCLYEEEYNTYNDCYEILDPPLFERTLEASSTGWNNYSNIFYLDYGVHYTIAFYPYNEDAKTKTFFNLDRVSLITYEPKEIENSGTYEDPFTEEDMDLSYTLEANSGIEIPVFSTYHIGLPQKEYFVYYNSSYYCTNGAKDALGRFICYSNVIVSSPCGLSGSRYFFPDGKMARNKLFEYNGVHYQADTNGELTRVDISIYSIWTKPIIEMLTINSSEYQKIKVYFDNQPYNVTLNAEIQDTSVATVSNIISGTNSNEIEIYGKSRGKTRLRIYYRNNTGIVAETNIEINVVDEIETTEGKVYIAYNTNSVGYDKVLTIDYFILPEYVSELPLEWSSSDKTIATVDSYGNVLGRTYGSCVITATNSYNKQSASCTIHVGNIRPPYKITTSIDEIELSIGETKRATAELYDESNYTTGVVQDIKWESNNAKVATVNKYGFITGVSRGIAEITCYSAGTPSVKKTITVHIVGTPIEPQGIELDCDDFIRFDTSWSNNSISVSHRFVPSNANTSGVVWESSNEDAVKVTQGGVVYLNPSYEGGIDSSIITCRCSNAPTIYKEFKVGVNLGNPYKTIVSAFDTEFDTYIGQTLMINYNLFYLSGEFAPYTLSILEETTNEIISDENGRVSNFAFVAKETGTFTVLLLVASYSKRFTIHVHEENNPPQLVDGLRVVYALQNDSCVLSCQIKDDPDKLDNIDFYIDFGDGNGYEAIYDFTNLLAVNPDARDQYFFISGYGLTPGTIYRTRIKAVDAYGLEAVTNSVDLAIPESNTNKDSLAAAKTAYDETIELLLNTLSSIIEPTESIIPEHHKPTFYIQYKLYCYTYDNLRDMLNKCIDHINSQIKTSQSEVAALATGLTSDGVSVATYSESDYTNSNYQNITDMDYYQNVCIKELVNRVLQLEALVQQLISNNNN